VPGPGFKISDAVVFAAIHGLQQEINQIQSMLVHPSIKKPAVVRKGSLPLPRCVLADKFAQDGFVAISFANEAGAAAATTEDHSCGTRSHFFEKREQIFIFPYDFRAWLVAQPF